MCFDEEGNYKHSLIYFTTFSNHDGVQFRLREDGNIELKSKGQTESYVCDPEGNIISIYSSGEFESTENQKEIESFSGRRYKVRNFMYFSQVVSSDGKCIYRQSLLSIVSYSLVSLGVIAAIVFFFLLKKKKGISIFDT